MAITDFLELDRTLSDEQRIVRDTVRRFVDAEVLPHIGQWCAEGRFPEHLIPMMGEMGLFGSTLPEEYGCAQVDSLTYGLIMQELERGDSGLRSFASVQSGLVMYPIFSFGNDEQKKQWLPKMATGEKIGCFGLTEPDGGSNPIGMKTRAVKDGKQYVLSGAKMWITNGNLSDVAVVFAQTGAAGDHRAVRGFLVEKGTPGFKVNEVQRKIGLRASNTSELVFEDCRIPAENLLPGTSQGLKCALMCLNQARYGIAFGAVGAAIGCFEEAVGYTAQRAPFGKSLDHYQITQMKLADILTQITLGQLICFRLAALKDAGALQPEQISMAKRNNCRMALETARRCRELLGANGITYEFHAGRHETNLISVDTYEGTYEVHTLILGQKITGKNAFD